MTKAPTSEQSKPAKDVGVNGSSTGDDENNNETGASGDEGGKEKSDEDNEDKRERGEKEEGGNGFKQTIKKLSDMLSNNKSAVQNMMFALIGLTSLVVLYFIIKTMRLVKVLTHCSTVATVSWRTVSIITHFFQVFSLLRTNRFHFLPRYQTGRDWRTER